MNTNKKKIVSFVLTMSMALSCSSGVFAKMSDVSDDVVGTAITETSDATDSSNTIDTSDSSESTETNSNDTDDVSGISIDDLSPGIYADGDYVIEISEDVTDDESEAVSDSGADSEDVDFDEEEELPDELVVVRDEDDSDDVSDLPGMNGSTEATTAPTATPTIAPVAADEADAENVVGEAANTPEVTEVPSKTDEPDSSGEPEITITPEVTIEPEATATPDVTATPDATSTPEATVNPDAIDVTDDKNLAISVIDSQIYTGEKITPDLFITYGVSELFENIDYTLLYENNIEIGTATITINFMGNYTGNRIIEFLIVEESEVQLMATSGTCGDDLTWEFDSTNQRLTISGTGNMNNYSSGKAPWYSNREYIPGIVIESGVTSIGNYAFYSCDLTNGITFKSTCAVTSIGNSAFESTGLKKITLPDCLESIGGSALESCTSLTSIVLPDSVTSSGTEVFYNCTALASATGNIPLSTYAFRNCSALTSIVIPEGKTKIGDSTFLSCTSLTTVTIPNSVTHINAGAFGTCGSITDVYYYGSEYDWEGGQYDYGATEPSGYAITIEGVDYKTGTAANGYLVNATIHYTLASDSITVSDVDESYTYTGSAIKPTPTVTYGNGTLTSGTDYSISYKNNTNVGTATITITGKGDYSGTATITFEITQITLTSDMVSSIPEQTYTGSTLTPEITVTYNGTTLTEDTDYEVTASSTLTNVGTYKITFTGINNYTGSVSTSFIISEATPTIEANATSYTKTYGDNAFTLGASTTSGTTLSYTSSNTSVVTVTTSSGGTVTIVGAGTATITITSAASLNYASASTTVSITVNKADPTWSGTTSYSKTYGDSSFYVTQTTDSGGTITYSVTSGSSYATVGSSTGLVTIKGVGTTKIKATVASADNYNSDTRTITITISKATPTWTGTTEFNKNYGDASFDITQSVTGSGTVTYEIASGTDYISLNGSTVTIIGVGTATVTATAAASTNYNTSTRTITVTTAKATPTISVNSTSYTKTYGDAAFSLEATTTSGGTLSYSSSATGVVTVSGGTVTIVGAGSATITNTSTATSNYNSATKEITITVNKATPTWSGTTSFEKTYGDSSFSVAQTISGNGSITYSVTSGTSNATVNSTSGLVTINSVGSVTVTATAAASTNYTSSTRTISITINAMAMSDSMIGTISSYTYDGTAHEPTPTLTCTLNSGSTYTLKNGTDYTLSYSNNTNAGTATIIATGKGNFTGTASKTFEIGKAAPTWAGEAVFIATYGDDPFSVEQTVSGDGTITYAVTSGTSYVTVDSSTGEVAILGAGSAIITATAEESANYGSSAREITITIAQATPEWTGETAFTATYGDSSFSATQSVSGGGAMSYSSNDTSVVTVNSSGKITIIGAGTATITATAEETANYLADTRDLTITINKKAPTITSAINPYALTYGGSDTLISASVDSGGTLSYESGNTNIVTIIKDDSNVKISIVSAGETYIIIYSEAISNYLAGELQVPVTVNALKIAAATVEDIATQVYTGLEIEPELSITYEGVALVEGTDYTVTYSNNINVGTATATVTGIGNYTGTRTVPFIIDVVDISDATISDIEDCTYNGSYQTPSPTISIGDVTLTEGVDYELSYENNKNAGTATCTVTAIGENCTGYKYINFKINPRKATFFIIIVNSGKWD